MAYAAGVVGTFLVLVATAYWITRRTYRGFGHWVIALTLLVFALTAISWAQYAPSWLAEMTINAASIGAMIAAASGAHLFYRESPLDRVTTGLGMAGILAVFVVQFAGPEIVRAGLGGLVMGALALRAAVIFTVSAEKGLRLASWFCALLLLGMALERFWRASFFVSAVDGSPMSDPHLAALINHTFNATFITAWAVGLLMTHASRVELDLRKSRQELARRAREDSLTSLLNRRAFLELAELEHSRSVRHQIALSLVLIDLDHFKVVNDRFGHQAGDQVLQNLAGVLHASLRDVDVAARIGGEEFAVMLPNATLQQAVDACERLRARIQTDLIVPDTDHHVTASMGVGQWGEGESFNGIFARVDAALYRAKRAGRNQVQAATVDGASDQGPPVVTIDIGADTRLPS